MRRGSALACCFFVVGEEEEEGAPDNPRDHIFVVEHTRRWSAEREHLEQRVDRVGRAHHRELIPAACSCCRHRVWSVRGKARRNQTSGGAARTDHGGDGLGEGVLVVVGPEDLLQKARSLADEDERHYVDRSRRKTIVRPKLASQIRAGAPMAHTYSGQRSRWSPRCGLPRRRREPRRCRASP